MKFGRNLRAFFGFILTVSTLLAFASVYVSDARAKTISAKSGQNTQVGAIASYSAENCSSLLTNPSVKGSARNGKVTTKWINYTIKKGSCKGRTIKVIVVWYRSDKGFQGRDTVTVSYYGPRGTRYSESSVSGPTARKINIKVK